MSRRGARRSSRTRRRSWGGPSTIRSSGPRPARRSPATRGTGSTRSTCWLGRRAGPVRVPVRGCRAGREGLADGNGVVIALRTRELGRGRDARWDSRGAGRVRRGAPEARAAVRAVPPAPGAARMEIIDLASDHVGRQLTKKLEENRIVALVADRDLSGGGVEVEMFGRTRRMPAGPALLSLSTGAPLISGPTFTTKDGWVEVLSEVSIEPTGKRKDDVRSRERSPRPSSGRSRPRRRTGTCSSPAGRTSRRCGSRGVPVRLGGGGRRPGARAQPRGPAPRSRARGDGARAVRVPAGRAVGPVRGPAARVPYRGRSRRSLRCRTAGRARRSRRCVPRSSTSTSR